MAGVNDNLIPFKKGEGTREEKAAAGRAGGIASGKARRKKADMQLAIQTLMDLPAIGDTKSMLKTMGYNEDELNNANAIAATLFAKALNGDSKALEMIVNYSFNVNEDARKTRESNARIDAMHKNGVDLTVNSGEEDGGVMIYLPAIDEEPDEEVHEE